MYLGHSRHIVPQGLKNKQRLVWATYAIYGRTVFHAHTLAFIAFATQNDSSASSLTLQLVLGTSFARQAPNPMMPYGRPGRGSKTRNQARCACAHLEYNAMVRITAGWHTSCIK